MNLAQRPEVAGVRTSVVYEHIRNPRIRRPPGVAREARHWGFPSRRSNPPHCVTGRRG